jgi:hypothetical protein
MQPWMLAAVALAAIAAGAFAAWRGPFELQMFLLYAALAFVAFLVWPIPSPITVPHWELMTRPGHHRYFIAPMFALFLVAVWMATRREWALRGLGTSVLAVALVFGVCRDWLEPPHPDLGYADSVAKYERAAPGDRVQIAFPPNWSIVLTKR